MPKSKKKRRRLASSDHGCIRKKAQHKDHVWSMASVFDRTEDGRSLKILAIVDEHTRECLGLLVRRRIKAEDVMAVLAHLFRTRDVR